MDDKTKAAMAAIGAKFREERRNKRKSTPRSEQTQAQLAATWKNPANGLATRTDAYQIWHARDNEGELLEVEGVLIILKSYDSEPVKT